MTSQPNIDLPGNRIKEKIFQYLLKSDPSLPDQHEQNSKMRGLFDSPGPYTAIYICL